MPTPLTDDEIRFLLSVCDAARSGDVDALGIHLDAGIPVNLTNGSGDTLLILAAYHDHLSAVQLLLNRGADVDRINDRGQTALGAAVFRRSVPIVRALLASGADPDAGPRSARQVADFFDLDDMTRLLDGAAAAAVPSEGKA